MSNETLIAIGFIAICLGALTWRWYHRKPVAAKTETDFTVDLTDLAAKGKLEKVIGMEEVIERVLHVIARKQKNNPLIIGEPGVGKTAVVEGLAQRIVNNQVPVAFRDKRILSLNLADVMAGTKFRGELEGRLRALLKRLEDDPRKYILFIDEIHMLEQARGSEGALDIADVLKPALSRGELQVIGATTWAEYQSHIKPDAALERRFQPVLVEEPSRDTTVAILKGVKGDYEKFHGVCILDETIEVAVDQSIHFIRDRFLPDKALDVIDEACAKVAVETAMSHGASLGLLHAAAAKAKTECPNGSATVKPEDVIAIAEQWHEHRRRPQTT